MMNGRQRSPRGMSSHESGSTIRKKIAKVAVGKSTGGPVGQSSLGGGSLGCVSSPTSVRPRTGRSTDGANQDGSVG